MAGPAGALRHGVTVSRRTQALTGIGGNRVTITHPTRTLAGIGGNRVTITHPTRTLAASVATR
jgi:hypothetical protein